MCGLIYCKKTNKNEKANKLIIKRFEKQKTRGTQGFGYVELKNGIVMSETRTQTEPEIMKKLEKCNADEILFHHRTPTSTPNVIESTHPIKVSHKSLKYNYYVIHNGIISNDDTLRDEQMKLGYTYTTDITKKWITRDTVYHQYMWNDSESVAIDLAQAIETGKEMTSKGSIAIIALQYDKKTGQAIALYYGRNTGNPLCIENDKNFFALSSETGKSIPPNILFRYDYNTNVITQKDKKIGDYYESATTFYDYDRESGYTWKLPNEDEEDDFEIGLLDEEQELEQMVQDAYDAKDYDLADALGYDLENIRRQIDREKIQRYE